LATGGAVGIGLATGKAVEVKCGTAGRAVEVDCNATIGQ